MQGAGFSTTEGADIVADVVNAMVVRCVIFSLFRLSACSTSDFCRSVVAAVKGDFLCLACVPLLFVL